MILNVEKTSSLCSVKVATGVIYNQSNEILISKRLSGKHLAGLWEFPGGKIEKDETAFAALKRELHEEINIDVIEATPLTQVEFTYPEQHIVLDVWRVIKFSGIAIGKEGQEIKWVKQIDLSNYPFPEVNQRIFKWL